MADFLASFNLAPEPSAASNARGCTSLEQVRDHLRGLVGANVSESRASHVSTVVQLRDTARLELRQAENENDSLASQSGNQGPSATAPRAASAEGEGGRPVKVVTALETLRNQPLVDPVLQKAVAKHIVAAVGEADSSTWTIREVSRQGQGWTFTYHCRDSVQQWTRQNAKTVEMPVIGEWYYKDPEPILDNRPAFDCRGTLTIAFPRNGRSISVKYEHTPMHRTVAQLREYFKPVPRPQPPKKTAEAKTPKPVKTKTPKEPKDPRAQKTPKTPRTPTADKDGQPKEKRKKRKSTVGGSAKPRKRKKHNGAEAEAVRSNSPSMFVDSDHPSYDTSAATTSKAGSSTGSQSFAPSASAYTLLPSVPPAEATRRKDVAMKLLTEAGVNPATLTGDQLSIFANQSPELQKDSLAMLVKYGAGRLRIVQPATEQRSTPASSTRSSATAAVTTKELVPQHRDSLPDAPDTSKRAAEANGGGRKMGKSRLACYQCKERRVKCSKEQPRCEGCVKESRPCSYPPRPPRSKAANKKKSEVVVVQSDEEDLQSDNDQEPETQGESNVGPSNASTWQMPAANMLGPNVEATVHNPQPEAPGYYQSATGLPLKEAEDAHHPTDMSAASNLTHLHSRTDSSAHMLPNPPQQPYANSQGIVPTAVESGRGSLTSMRSTNIPVPLPASIASSAYRHQAAAGQSNSQQGSRPTSAAPRERVQQHASPRVAASGVAQGRASPSQQGDQGRARPRPGQRSQTRTLGNSGGGISPTAHASTRHNTQPSVGTGNDDSGDRIPYQPYSQGPTSQPSHQNTGLALPTTMASVGAASYLSTSARNQWAHNNTQQATNRSYAAASDMYNQTASKHVGANSMDTRASRGQQQQQQQQQQQKTASHRDYQSFGSQQPQQGSQHNGNAQQQSNWFGLDNGNHNGSYSSSGHYWS